MGNLDSERELSEVEIKSPAQTVSMTEDWYELISPEHFWISWRHQIVVNILRPLITAQAPRAFDIGCGNGLFMQEIEKSLPIVVDGCDLNVVALRDAKAGKGTIFQYNIFDRNPDLLGRYDIVFLLDVIEHIDDHVGFVKVAREYLRPGGLMVINVPCLPTLFSAYDTAAGHRRRYTPALIRSVVNEARLSAIHVSYWGMTLVPLLLLRKLLVARSPSTDVIRRGFKPPSRAINEGLQWLGQLERLLVHCPPLGTSLVAIARFDPDVRPS